MPISKNYPDREAVIDENKIDFIYGFADKTINIGIGGFEKKFGPYDKQTFEKVLSDLIK